MLKTLILIFKYAKNPVSTILNYLLFGRGTMVLKNGIQVKFKKGDGQLSAWCNALKKGWVVEKRGDLFIFRKDDWTMIQPNIGALGEDFETEYGVINYEGKVVFDVGAYFGETAILFHKKGAKKIVCFEPLKEHLVFLKKNIKLNKVPAEIYCVGISDRDGYLEIQTDPETILRPGFGLRRGTLRKKVKTISWETLLKMAVKKKADVLKVDCEGCENFLLEVPTGRLKLVPMWIIEFHCPTSYAQIRRKFISAGFLEKVIKKKGDFIISLFELANSN